MHAFLKNIAPFPFVSVFCITFDHRTEAGEFEVISSLLRDSIPTLIGWRQLVDRAVSASVDDAIKRMTYQGREGNGSNVPF